MLASQFVQVEHNYRKSAMDVDISRDPESEGEVISVSVLLSLPSAGQLFFSNILTLQQNCTRNQPLFVYLHTKQNYTFTGLCIDIGTDCLVQLSNPVHTCMHLEKVRVTTLERALEEQKWGHNLI